MSQTTFSYSPNKRARTFSQLSNRSNASNNFMQSTPTLLTRVGPKREVGGSGVQRAGTAGTKNKKKLKIPYGWLEKLLFPPTYVKVLGYGMDFYGKNSSTISTAESGDCKMLRGKPGRQLWAEFEALPLYNPTFETETGTTLQTWNISCRKTIENLISHAADNKWVDSVMDRAAGIDITTALGTPTALSISDLDMVPYTAAYSGPSANVKLNKAFIYNGGHQRHTFINHSNASQWIEVCEAIPRDPQFDFYDISVGGSDAHLAWSSIGDLVLADYKDNAVKGISGSYLSDITAIDTCDDVSVKISSACRRTLAKYKISKPITICLAPGEQFVYTMDLKPFMFDNLGFAEHMTIPFPHEVGGFQRVSTLKIRPTSIPRFTKRLVVRCWGEMSHSDVNAGVNTAFTGTLQPVQVNLFHLMEEEHKVRFAPVMNKNFAYIKYTRDVADTSFGLQVFDDANEAVEAIDD